MGSRPIAPVLVLLLGSPGACVPPDAPTPAPPSGSWSVAIAPPEGIHPLQAQTSGERDDVTWSWAVDGAEAPFDGPVVPADALWPGQRWTVTATAGDQTATDEVVVPAPAGGNVLLVVVDDLGMDKFNASGLVDPPMPTPNLDRLADEGMVFENAYASPVCSATRAQLLTGRHARRTGIGELVGGGTAAALSPEALLTPEALRASRAGTYATAALGKYHLAAGNSEQGFDGPNLQGFDTYAGSYDNLVERPTGYFHWRKVVDGVPHDVDVYATTDTADDAIAQIRSLPEPWFVVVAFNAPHTPYHVPPAALHTRDVGPDSAAPELHAAMLEALDTEFGRLMRAVDPHDTTTILVADNGTGMAAVQRPFLKERAKHSVYEGGTHVPLVVHGPLVAAPGSRTAALVHAVDVFATVVDIAGVPLTADPDGGVVSAGLEQRRIDGISLVPWLREPERPSARQTVFAETFWPLGAPPYEVDEVTVRDERYKLVRSTLGGETSIELYDLEQRWFDEGEDLLADGVSLDDQLALDRLSAALDDQLALLGYDGY